MTTLVNVNSKKLVDINQYGQGVNFDQSDMLSYIPTTINQLLNVVGNNIVLRGFDVTPSISLDRQSISVKIAPGTVIEDETLIDVSDFTNITFTDAVSLSSTGKFIVFCRFQYLEYGVENPFKFGITYIDNHGQSPTGWYHDKNNIVLGCYQLEIEDNNIISINDAFIKETNFVVDNSNNLLETNDGELIILDSDVSSILDYVVIHERVYYKDGYDPDNITLQKYICNSIKLFCDYYLDSTGINTPATSESYGLVKIGQNIINNNGTISVAVSSPTTANSNIPGLVIPGDNINIQSDGTISVNTSSPHIITDKDDTVIDDVDIYHSDVHRAENNKLIDLRSYNYTIIDEHGDPVNIDLSDPNIIIHDDGTIEDTSTGDIFYFADSDNSNMPINITDIIYNITENLGLVIPDPKTLNLTSDGHIHVNITDPNDVLNNTPGLTVPKDGTTVLNNNGEFVINPQYNLKNNVRVATNSIISDFVNYPVVVDDVYLYEGDRILLKDASQSELNGLYYVESSGLLYYYEVNSINDLGTLIYQTHIPNLKIRHIIDISKPQQLYMNYNKSLQTIDIYLSNIDKGYLIDNDGNIIMDNAYDELFYNSTDTQLFNSKVIDNDDDYLLDNNDDYVVVEDSYLANSYTTINDILNYIKRDHVINDILKFSFSSDDIYDYVSPDIYQETEEINTIGNVNVIDNDYYNLIDNNYDNIVTLGTTTIFNYFYYDLDSNPILQTDNYNSMFTPIPAHWLRTNDTNTDMKISRMQCYIQEGRQNGDSHFILTNNLPINLNSTPLNYKFLIKGEDDYEDKYYKSTIKSKVHYIRHSILSNFIDVIIHLYDDENKEYFYDKDEIKKITYHTNSIEIELYKEFHLKAIIKKYNF